MSQSRFTLPVAVFILLVKDGKVLMHRRKNTGWYDGSYEMPSGHIDGGEPLTTTVCREAKEEVGVDINKRDVTFVAFFHSFSPEDGKEYMYAFFEVRHWQGEPQIMEPDKCDGLGWFDLDNVPENLTPGARIGLKAYKEGVRFAESGF